MAEEPRIINTFQQRRQLEEALATLAATHAEAELVDQVRAIADRFSAELLVAAVQRNLGTTSSQVRGGIGHLCALLPPELIVPPLRAVVADRQHAPLQRTTAALILERYLGETVSPALMGDLAGSDDAAFQSLLEAIEEGRTNRHVLLEYVTQMAEHPVDVAFMVLGLLDRLAPADRVELLRLIAQDQRHQVARVAVERLALLAAAEAGETAHRALYVLAQTLSPTLAELCERSLRKLQFTGRRFQPPDPAGWHALLSAADTGGFATLWFVHDVTDPAREDGALLAFVLAPADGVLQFSGVETMEQTQLPSHGKVGDLVNFDNGGGKPALLLQIPFEVGRALVSRTLDAWWARDAQADLPGEYKLYNDLLWQFAPAEMTESLAPFLAEEITTGLEQPDVAALEAAAGALIEHPIFAGWVGWATAVWSTLQPARSGDSTVNTAALTGVVLREIDGLPNRSLLQTTMAAALRMQALWLKLDREEKMSGHAALLARWMTALPVRKNPLLAGLLHAGLERTLHS
ncbi:MAG TPA: hypothetical protein P5333_07240 [Caldilinea sp.]|nr:hypothetical protein [Caldilinea sp.]